MKKKTSISTNTLKIFEYYIILQPFLSFNVENICLTKEDLNNLKRNHLIRLN